MMINGTDPVLGALGALAAAAPPDLSDRLFSGWLAAPSRLGEVYVAFSGEGVQFVRSAESVDGDPAAFTAAYRRRFARPLRIANRAPAGLLTGAARADHGGIAAAGPGRAVGLRARRAHRYPPDPGR